MSSTERRQRVADLIRRVVAEMLLTDIKRYDFRAVTILRCEVSGDLHEADIRYSVLGDEDDRAQCAHHLDRILRFVQRRLGQELSMYRPPTIRFVYDNAVQEGLRLDELFTQIERERKNDDQGSGPKDSDGA
ncbi:MAG TPA: 30S ribosome-binding factor RbfA [candidate division Zixibacteria bacterium]|jgi:ribosome-binding factor A